MATTVCGLLRSSTPRTEPTAILASSAGLGDAIEVTSVSDAQSGADAGEDVDDARDLVLPFFPVMFLPLASDPTQPTSIKAVQSAHVVRGIDLPLDVASLPATGCFRHRS